MIDLLICTGQDFQYMGHGQCSNDHCGLISSTYDVDQHEVGTISLSDLPLVHLFVDKSSKTVPVDPLLRKIDAMPRDNLLERGFLALVFDAAALKYLLKKPWSTIFTPTKENAAESPVPPKILVQNVHDLLFCIRPTFPVKVEKCTEWIKKVYDTTSLEVNGDKLPLLGAEVVKYHGLKKFLSAKKQAQREIKKYLTQNKTFAVSKEAQTQTAWSSILQKELGGGQMALCKWASELAKSGWTVQDDFKELLGSGPDDPVNQWLTSRLRQKWGQESLMDHLIACSEQKLFGAKRGGVAIGVQRKVIEKFELREMYRGVLEKSLELDILRVVDLTQMKVEDVILCSSNRNDFGEMIAVSKFHQLLRAASKEQSWNRQFFEELQSSSLTRLLQRSATYQGGYKDSSKLKYDV